MMCAAKRDDIPAISGDELEIASVAGTPVQISLLWLRDNCACDECRVPQTGEKRFLISTVPADLSIVDAKVDNGELAVTWWDGHRSHYRLDALLDRSRLAPARYRRWPAAYTPHRIDYADFLNQDDVALQALELLQEFGAIVLSNAPIKPLALESLAPRLGPVRELMFDRIHDVHVDPAGYNVAHTALPLPPHNDFASYSWPPSVQVLHMLANETPGGESVIVDGWSVLEELREEFPEHFKSLCEMPVPFREYDDGIETYAVEPIIRLNTDGHITGLRYSNQLMQRIDPTRPGVSAFYQAYRELCLRINDDTAKVRFRLNGGEMLVLASHRVLHGREAFEPVARRHLQDAYFELDNASNHAFVLRGQGA